MPSTLTACPPRPFGIGIHKSHDELVKGERIGRGTEGPGRVVDVVGQVVDGQEHEVDG